MSSTMLQTMKVLATALVALCGATTLGGGALIVEDGREAHSARTVAYGVLLGLLALLATTILVVMIWSH